MFWNVQAFVNVTSYPLPEGFFLSLERADNCTVPFNEDPDQLSDLGILHHI